MTKGWPIPQIFWGVVCLNDKLVMGGVPEVMVFRSDRFYEAPAELRVL